jgi:hypothetical protein
MNVKEAMPAYRRRVANVAEGVQISAGVERSYSPPTSDH